jgi:hypothetical protein
MPQLKSTALAASGGAQKGRRRAQQSNAQPWMNQGARTSRKPLPVPGKTPDWEKGTREVPAYAAMMVDPLNAPLAPLPDMNDRATLLSKFRDTYDVVPTATGHYFQVTGPAPAFNYTYSETTTAPIQPGAGTRQDSQFSVSLQSDSALIRTLAFVVQWMPTQSENNNSGRIFFGTYNCTAAGAVPIKPYAAYFNDDGDAYAAHTPCAFVVRVSQSANVFVDPATTGPLPAVAPLLVVSMTGLTGTAVVGELVVTRIIEAIPLGNTLSYSRARKTPCDMTSCCIAANLVSTATRSHGGDKSYADMVQAGTKIAKSALRLYTAYSSGGASELASLVGG